AGTPRLPADRADATQSLLGDRGGLPWRREALLPDRRDDRAGDRQRPAGHVLGEWRGDGGRRGAAQPACALVLGPDADGRALLRPAPLRDRRGLPLPPLRCW